MYTMDTIWGKTLLAEPLPTTHSSTHKLLESVRNAYLEFASSDEAAADTVNVLEQLAIRDRLVFLLRAEVHSLDAALRDELERRKQLESGLRNWRLAREKLETLDFESQDVEL